MRATERTQDIYRAVLECLSKPNPDGDSYAGPHPSEPTEAEQLMLEAATAHSFTRACELLESAETLLFGVPLNGTPIDCARLTAKVSFID